MWGLFQDGGPSNQENTVFVYQQIISMEDWYSVNFGHLRWIPGYFLHYLFSNFNKNKTSFEHDIRFG